MIWQEMSNYRKTRMKAQNNNEKNNDKKEKNEVLNETKLVHLEELLT